jgi:hypothetical protein
MIPVKRCSSALIISLLLTLEANATELFSDDFTAPPVGSAPSPSKWGGRGNYVVRDDTTNPAFGSPSRFVRISPGGDSYTVVMTAKATIPTTGLLIIGFDFCEPSTGGDQLLAFGLGKSDELNGTHAGLAFTLRDGEFASGSNTSGPGATYALATPHRMTVVFNRSNGSVNYDFLGTNTLASGKADVWLGSSSNPAGAVKIGTYASLANTTSVNQFTFRVFSAATGNTVDVTNFSIHHTTPDILVLPWRSDLYPEDWMPPTEAAVNFDSSAFLQDFSYAGYRAGNEEIPAVAGPEWLVTDAPFFADPTGVSDSTNAIQAAIDAAANAGGGVVNLPAGTFSVRPQGSNAYALRINTSGVVLRGAGTGQTFLCNTSTEMNNKRVVLVQGPSNASLTAAGSASSPITTDLLGPSKIIPIEDASLFARGDWVTVRTDTTEAWITEHGANNWSGYGSNLGGLAYRRQVVAIDLVANTVVIDIPTRYAVKTRDNARLILAAHSGVHDVGLEDFSIGMAQRSGSAWGENDYQNSSNAAWHTHASAALYLERVRDCWVSNVESYQPTGNSTTAHLLSNGIIINNSYRVTLEDCHFQRPQYGGGGGNGYMYRINSSSDCLVLRCRSTFSRHGFVFAGMRTSGNVFHRCTDKATGKQTGNTGSQNTNGTGSDHHAHFSHSNLIDACTADSSYFTAAYRPYGTAPMHDVTAAHSVFWNTEGLGSGSAVVATEQSRYGYAIGTRGTRTSITRPTTGGARMAPADWVEGAGAGATLEPFSLYEDQLARRLPPAVFSPFAEWRARFLKDQDLANDQIAGVMADPDSDGLPNLLEFAIDGNPLSSSNEGKVLGRLTQEGAASRFIFTLPVRVGTVFHGPGDLVSEPVDGLIYAIQASSDLSDFVSVDVVEVPYEGTDMPDLHEGWEYRSFWADASTGNVFLRAWITETTELFPGKKRVTR